MPVCADLVNRDADLVNCEVDVVNGGVDFSKSRARYRCRFVPI